MTKSKTEGLEGSSSSATLTASGFYPSQSPSAPPQVSPHSSPQRASRLVSFSPDLSSISPMPLAVKGATSSSVVHSTFALSGNGSAASIQESVFGYHSRTLPSPSSPTPQTPTQSRGRSRSRISQSGSMVNLMNLVRSRSMSRSRTEGATRAVFGDRHGAVDGQSRITAQASGMETSLSVSMSGWFGKACSFIRPWGDGSGHGGDAGSGGGSSDWIVTDSEETVPPTEEGKRAFVETREVKIPFLV